MENLKVNEMNSALNFSRPIGNFINDISGTSAINEFNAREAQKQRDWEEEMSNSAYQRAAEDMKKAGLNPYLMYNGASAAAVPQGGVGQSNNNQNTAGQLINSAFNLVGKMSENKTKQDANIINAMKLMMKFLK